MRAAFLLCLTRGLLGTLVGSLVLGAAAPGGGMDATPLAPRSGPRGRTMFVPLAARETGIVTENPYADPKMWAEHYQEFVYGAIGCGLAVADFDRDGKPDLFVVSKTGQCRLFRNLGQWKFEDVTAKAGLLEGAGGGWLDRARNLVGGGAGAVDVAAWKQGAAFADVNNDGWPDIYVCRFNAPNLLYINQHDGTFTEEAAARGLAMTDASGMAAFCDYDRDGWLDVYVHTNMLDAARHPKGQRDQLFHNRGDGTFENVTDRAGISGEGCAHSATWWDYDGDQWPDLYVANDYDVPDKLYHNNRDGTFTNRAPAVLPHTPYYAMGADLGDVNNDGRIDFLVADMAGSTHEKDQRGMAGSRERAQIDAATAPPQYMRSALYLNAGVGRLREAAYLTGLAATDWTWSVRFEDLDNDGRLDVHFTNGMVREFHNADILARIMAADSIAESWRLVRSLPPMQDRHVAFRNLGDLRFEDASAAWGLDQTGVSFGAAFADFDGDGDLDLVYTNYEAGVTVLRNDSDAGHRLVVALQGTQSNRFGVGATVRLVTASGVQVRTLVLARGQMATSEPILHFGLGDDARVQRLTVEWPSGAVQTFEDLPVDRRLVVTEPTEKAGVAAQPSAPTPAPQFVPQGGAIQAAVTNGPRRHDVETQPFVPFSFAHPGPALAVGRLDGDNHMLAVFGGEAGFPGHLLRPVANGVGPGSVTQVDLPTNGTPSRLPDGPLLVFDADGDGADDLLVTKAGTAMPAGSEAYQPRLWLNDGRGGLQMAPEGSLPALPISVGALAAADFDRDGTLDLFVGARVLPGSYPLSPRSALLANRNGRFEDVTDRLAPGLREAGLVTSALWTDADGDGWLDLVVTLEWGHVMLWHNEGGRGFTDWTERSGFASAGTGWWTAVASADFNGDGRPDYALGNLGLNTRYHADPAHPALVFYGDFAQNGAPFLIEAHYEGDRIYPWASRNALGAKLPAVLQRYRRNDLYARATLNEIVGEPALAKARRFAATELRSGMLLSTPDGTYTFAPLPRIAQIAPVHGLAAGDFDGDGNADLYALQNSSAPRPAIGDFDGGLSQLLRGDGAGHLLAVEPADSGLVVAAEGKGLGVTGEGKALAVIDVDDDGWPDFVLSGTDAPIFRNRGVPGRHSLRVELQGPKGNASAIGARITLELAKGRRQTAEIAAGSGYLSQSAPYAFFGYDDNDAPRRISVRWPDGKTTSHDVAGAIRSIRLTER